MESAICCPTKPHLAKGMCKTHYSRAWNKAHPKPETRRRNHLRVRYQLTPEQYAEMLTAQGGGCAICGRKPGKRNLHVDHLHSTNRVRALLCGRCNLSVGVIESDDYEKFVQYVEIA